MLPPLVLLLSASPLLLLPPPCESRRFHLGPTVDPGVFVLTHVGSCRKGKGYCVLGFSCGVDKDFAADDLGGHCDGLRTAFSPETRSGDCGHRSTRQFLWKPFFSRFFPVV